MTPAIETFITFAVILAIILAAAAWFGRPIWHRVWKYFCNWRDEDRLLEEARRAQSEFRVQAEREVKDCLYESEVETSARPISLEDKQTRSNSDAIDQKISQEKGQ
jgi:hypothetical protein